MNGKVSGDAGVGAQSSMRRRRLSPGRVRQDPAVSARNPSGLFRSGAADAPAARLPPQPLTAQIGALR
jgi:hypothetical protein